MSGGSWGSFFGGLVHSILWNFKVGMALMAGGPTCLLSGVVMALVVLGVVSWTVGALLSVHKLGVLPAQPS